MMLNKLLKSQKLNYEVKKFITKDIFDIVIYGSAVRGKEKIGDIDIAIILNKKINLNEKLKMAQSLREKLEFLDAEVDVKVVDFYDFMDASFIARQAILGEGFSLIKRRFIHEYFGFSCFALFLYNMDNLTNSQKKMLYYALKGRRGEKGLLEAKDGKQLSDCIIKVPLQSYEEFKSLFEQHNVKYKAEILLSYSF